MESKKKSKSLVFEEQMSDIKGWSEANYNIISESMQIESEKNDEHYTHMMQKLGGMQNQIDQHTREIKEAIAKRSSESTHLHDISDKLSGQHYNKLHDLVKDSHNTTSANLLKVVDAIKDCGADIAQILEHIISNELRWGAILLLVNSACSLFIVYRLLTCL